MKKLVLLSLSATVFVAMGGAPVWAQSGRIYRCGNVYTNSPPPGQKDCKPVSGGNVTIVPSSRVGSDGARATPAGQAAAGLEGERLRQRNAEARQAVEAEIRKAQAKQEDLLKQYNNGEPDKEGPESRNHQRYLDRVANLKSDIDRNENQIEDMQRELDRIGSESK